MNSRKKFSTLVFAPGDIVILKEHENDPVNRFGVVQSVVSDGRIWISNRILPLRGTVTGLFKPNEIRLRRTK